MKFGKPIAKLKRNEQILIHDTSPRGLSRLIVPKVKDTKKKTTTAKKGGKK